MGFNSGFKGLMSVTSAYREITGQNTFRVEHWKYHKSSVLSNPNRGHHLGALKLFELKFILTNYLDLTTQIAVKQLIL